METANYRIGSYEGRPHFQCLLCPRDTLEESLMKSHLIQEHQQEPHGAPDDRPAEQPETAAAAGSTTSKSTSEPSEPTSPQAPASSETDETETRAKDRESSAKRKER